MRRKLALATASNGVASLAPQLLALFTLGSAAFGTFSVGYLAFALATSIVLSCLCDVWAITDKLRLGAGWQAYSSILLGLCLVMGVIGGLVTAAFTSWSIGLAAAGCVVLACYRLGGRYFLVHIRAWDRAVGSDVLAIVGTCVGFLLGDLFVEPVGAVLLGWALGALLGAVVLGPPRLDVKGATRWLREHRRLIWPLLADSLLMDVASIGTPYLLLPHLGLSGFGVYRALSNLSAPFRLLLSPVRPLVLGSPGRALSRSFTCIVCALAVLAGAAVSLALWALSNSIEDFGVLGELGPFWAPAGLYCLATILVVFYSLVCRALEQPRLLLFGRVSHTITGFVGPIVGVVWLGVEGAIWAFAVSTFVSALVWILMAFVGKRTTRSV